MEEVTFKGKIIRVVGAHPDDNDFGSGATAAKAASPSRGDRGGGGPGGDRSPRAHSGRTTAFVSPGNVVPVDEQLAEGRERLIHKMLQHLFLPFSNLTIVSRENLIESCRRMLEGLSPALQNYFAKLLADPLLNVLPEEKDPKIIREIASLLQRVSVVLIQFLQYPLASRILLNLQVRRKQLEEAKDPFSQRLAKILDRKLDPGVQSLLMADLNSEEPFRHQNAILLLGILGRTAIPLLMDVDAIKKMMTSGSERWRRICWRRQEMKRGSCSSGRRF
jgi:hypothetical protein